MAVIPSWSRLYSCWWQFANWTLTSFARPFFKTKTQWFSFRNVLLSYKDVLPSWKEGNCLWKSFFWQLEGNAMFFTWQSILWVTKGMYYLLYCTAMHAVLQGITFCLYMICKMAMHWNALHCFVKCIYISNTFCLRFFSNSVHCKCRHSFLFVIRQTEHPTLRLTYSWNEKKISRVFSGATRTALLKALKWAPTWYVWADTSTFTSYPDLIQRLAIKGIWDVSSVI